MNKGLLHHEHTYDVAAVEAAAAQEQRAAQEAQAAAPTEEAAYFQNQEGILRRTVVKDIAIVAVAATVPKPKWMSRVKDWAKGTLKDVIAGVGRSYDELIGTEQIIPGPTVSLAPRRDNTPSVEPKPRGEPVAAWPTFTPEENKPTTLRFAPTLSAEAEHFPHQDLKLGEGVFAERGFAIITTAPGLVRGEQESVRLFQDDTTGQLVGLGLKGGIYVYKTELGKPGVTKGEFVRVVTRPDKNAPPSPLISAKTWAEMQDFISDRFFVQDKERGINTLRRAGYAPFGALLPTTETPDTRTMTLTPETCTTDPAASPYQHKYWITKNGDIIDMKHLGAKSEEALRLATELTYMAITGAKNPVARVKYARGYTGDYEFAIDPSALKLENVVDMTASIMNTVTTLMEGLSQRILFEVSPQLDRLTTPSHFSPEDGFTNTLGITGMLGTMKELGILEELTARLHAQFHQNPHLGEKEMEGIVNDLLRDLRPRMVRTTVERLVAELDVREQTTAITKEMPLNPFHEISTKSTPEDAANPTFIDVRKAGINPDNTEAHHYRPLNVAIFEVTGNEVSKRLLN